MRRPHFSISNLLRDEQGNIAILFGLSVIPLIMMTGIALDYGRAYTARANAGAALDAAALATAKAMNEREMSQAELTRMAVSFFNANVGDHPGVTYDGVRVTTDAGDGTVTVAVDGVVPTSFARVMNFNAFTIGTAATARYKSRDLEVGLMLDVTGSMGDHHKIDDLKNAVTVDLLPKLLPGSKDTRGTRVALVPYSAFVNVGDYASDVTGLSARNRSDDCVAETTNKADLYRDATPGKDNRFRYVADRDRTDYGSRAEIVCPNARIVPLTNDRDALENTVRGYRPEGRTAGHLGIAWAWYMVSRNWASFWPRESAPARPNKNLLKAVVLMTDGEFNTAYTLGGHPSQRAQTAESYKQTQNLCEAIKNDGVMVFTIGFDLGGNADAVSALEACASDDTAKSGGKLFFRADNGTDLRTAYANIASKLSALRVVN